MFPIYYMVGHVGRSLHVSHEVTGTCWMQQKRNLPSTTCARQRVTKVKRSASSNLNTLKATCHCDYLFYDVIGAAKLR